MKPSSKTKKLLRKLNKKLVAHNFYVYLPAIFFAAWFLILLSK